MPASVVNVIVRDGLDASGNISENCRYSDNGVEFIAFVIASLPILLPKSFTSLSPHSVSDMLRLIPLGVINDVTSDEPAVTADNVMPAFSRADCASDRLTPDERSCLVSVMSTICLANTSDIS